MGKADSERWGGISSAAVEARTGKGWPAWFRILDQAGASKMPHKEIARLLREQHAVPGWWSQMITVGYEQARGLRAAHEKADGFSASASKTFPVPVDEIFRHFNDQALRARWLGEAALTIRKATPAKSMRVTWGDGTNLEINFWSKGDCKSSVQIEHDKLKDEASVQLSKSFWKDALARLALQLTTPPSRARKRA